MPGVCRKGKQGRSFKKQMFHCVQAAKRSLGGDRSDCVIQWLGSHKYKVKLETIVVNLSPPPPPPQHTQSVFKVKGRKTV